MMAFRTRYPDFKKKIHENYGVIMTDATLWIKITMKINYFNLTYSLKFLQIIQNLYNQI